MFFKNFLNKIKDLEKSNKNLEERVEKLEEIIYRDKINERIYKLEKRYSVKITEDYTYSIYTDYYYMEVRTKKTGCLIGDVISIPTFNFDLSKKFEYINSEEFENQILGFLNKYNLLEVKEKNKDKKGNANGTK